MSVTSATHIGAPIGGARRKRRRLAPFVAVSMIVAASAAVGWLAAKVFIGPIAEQGGVEVWLPASEGDQRGAQSRQASPPTIVASYPLNLSYVLSQWAPGKRPSGLLEGAKLGDRVLTTDGATAPVARGDVITLTGWAGERGLGGRYPYVLISACGKVVAHAAVNLARPDVAKAVHVNLGRSGWRAQIALRHLPDCEPLVLNAWGVAPVDSKLILPLNGKLVLFVKSKPQPTYNAHVSSAAPPLRPADMKQIGPIRLTVTANELILRRCADTDCPIVGQLAKGEWTVLTLDDSNGWLLVATPKRAGWVSKRDVGVAQRPG